jgi:hypothetical protein
MESHPIRVPDKFCYLTKHQLNTLFYTPIIQNLIKSSHPQCRFEDLYAQFDSCDRRIIEASQFKEYLIRLDYTEWGEISKIIPGIEMEKVTASPKLNQVIMQNEYPRLSPDTAQKKEKETYR